MHLKSILFSLLCLASASSYSQYKKVIYRDTTLNFDDYTIYLVDFVAAPTELKFKIRILNRSKDFIQYRPEQSSFVVNGQKMAIEPDLVVVGPNETKNKVVRVNGNGFQELRSFGFQLDGLSRVQASNPLIVEAFRLPAAENSFVAGPFRIDLVKVKKSTNLTEVLFKATYQGENDFGLVYPSNISVLMPDGKTYANLKTRYKHQAIAPGQSEDFYAVWERMPGGALNDMQKVDMLVQFNKVFNDTKSKEIEGMEFEFTWDEQLTRAAN